MKKVITLVLALVMVFAVATSASALVANNALGVVNTSDRYALSIEVCGGIVTGGSGLTIPTLAPNKAYVQNEILYYAITVVAKAAFNPATQVGDAAMTITGTGVNVAAYPELYGYRYNATNPAGAYWESQTFAFAPNAVYNRLALAANELNTKVVALGYDTNYVFCGMGLVTSTATAPSITVRIGMSAMTVGTVYNGLNNPAYKIAKLAANSWAVSYAGLTLRFNASATTGKCIGIWMSEGDLADPAAVGANEVEISKGNYFNAATQAWTYGWLKVADQTQPIDAATAAKIDAIFTFMGFDYELRDTNAIKEADFIVKTSETSLSATATVNAYAQQVTTDTVTVVPDTTTIQVPKTGSAASFAGIGLIVLAVVAAFVSKKVRA